MLRRLRLPKTALPDWLKLYNFVKEGVEDFYISGYISAREKLTEHSKKIKNKVWQNKMDEVRQQAEHETVEIVTRITKQGKYEALDLVILKVHRSTLERWRKELESEIDKPQIREDLVKSLDELFKLIDQIERGMEAALDQTPPKGGK